MQATAFFLLLALMVGAAGANAATIEIVNLDGPNEGFNDPTPTAAEGGNSGTTRGAQRLQVFQRAAQILGAQLQSNQSIKVGARFDSFNADPDLPQPACSSGGGILGFAGPTGISRNFPNAPFAGTWYPIALAEARAAANLNGAANEIDTSFNADVDAGCLGAGSRFWYGTSATSPSGNFIALLPVVLHELSHGLGFLTFVCTDANGCGTGSPQGSLLQNTPDIWTRFLANSNNAAFTWNQMSTEQRAASITGDPNTVWTGSSVSAAIGAQGITAGLSNNLLRMHAPSPVQPGSSISHFSSAASPNLLMEPAINGNLFAQLDMTVPLFRDIGWLAVSNQAPTLTLDVGNAAYSEDGAPVLVAPGASVSDAEGNWSGGRLSVNVNANASADDRLGIATQGGLSVSGTSVSDGAGIFATLNVAGGEVSGSAMLTATFNSAATTPQVQTLARSIRFSNVSDVPSTLTRTVDFALVDAAAASATGSRAVAVTATNDAPTLSLPAGPSLAEDFSAWQLAPMSFADVDADAGEVLVTIAAPSGTVTATASPAVSIGGTATARTLRGSLAAVNSLLTVAPPTYTALANTNGTLSLNVTIDDQGNTGGGGARSTSGNLTLQIAAVNDAPTVGAPASLTMLAGSTAAITPVSGADVDSPAGTIAVELRWSAPSGTFTHGGGAGVTVSGNGTSSLTLAGQLAAINALLATVNVQYSAGSNAAGVVPLTITLNDLGNSGSGGPRSGAATVSVTVQAPGTIFANGFEP